MTDCTLPPRTTPSPAAASVANSTVWIGSNASLLQDGVSADYPQGCVVCRPELSYSHVKTSIAASWVGFGDPDSGVTGYWLSVGSACGLQDVLPLTWVGLNTSVVQSATLLHNHTYYQTITALNGANLTNANCSDGVTIDVTPPIVQFVNDGITDDLQYSTLSDVLFNNYLCADPESGVGEYELAQTLNQSVVSAIHQNPSNQLGADVAGGHRLTELAVDPPRAAVGFLEPQPAQWHHRVRLCALHQQCGQRVGSAVLGRHHGRLQCRVAGGRSIQYQPANAARPSAKVGCGRCWSPRR